MPNQYTHRTLDQRFWDKVDPCRTDGCALWLGAKNGKDYGSFWFDGAVRKAHHFLVGVPPKGMEWDHVKERGCTHRNCVWPDHLEMVTHHLNTMRGESFSAKNAAKTHCAQGHPFDEANTIFNRWGRRCRICVSAHVTRQSKQRLEKRAAARHAHEAGLPSSQAEAAT